MARTTKPKLSPEPAVIEEAEVIETTAVEDAPPAESIAADTPKVTPERKPSVILPLALSAIVSAGVGFGTAYLARSPAPDSTAQTAALDDLARTNTDLAARIKALEDAPPPEPPAPIDLTPLEQRLGALEEQAAKMGDLDVASLSGDAGAMIAALRAEVARLQTEQQALAAQLATVQQDLTARMDAAEQAAQTTKADLSAASTALLRKAAIARLRAALDAGAPFADALADIPDLPAALAEHAQTGIPNTASLTESFAPAARAALTASLQATTGEGWLDRIGTFLRTSTGARSLTPREGDDPDAVLSRAGAAVQAGDLATALAEIAKLPAEGQAELAAWVTLANQRIAAVQAISDLAKE